VNRIKILASQSGMEEIKPLAFKAEMAIKRQNPDEAVGYTTRIGQILETYRKANIIK
jgi:hypothetical protein